MGKLIPDLDGRINQRLAEEKVTLKWQGQYSTYPSIEHYSEMALPPHPPNVDETGTGWYDPEKILQRSIPRTT